MAQYNSDSPLPLDYAGPEKQRGKRVGWTLWIIVALGGIGALVFTMMMPGAKTYVYYNDANCQSNLRQIGLCILLYANENKGVYPDSFQTLATAEGMTPSIFVCPASNDNPSTAPTTQEQIADMAKPGHVSYIYLGKGLTDKTVQPNQVIVYEPLANHGNGIDVLFGNGHAEFFETKRAVAIINAARASTQPIVLLP